MAVGYFQVVVEVYCMQLLECPIHQLLGLVLFKLVHDRKVGCWVGVGWGGGCGRVLVGVCVCG